jgi:hypothetical protein
MLGGFLCMCTCTCNIYCGIWLPGNTTTILIRAKIGPLSLLVRTDGFDACFGCRLLLGRRTSGRLSPAGPPRRPAAPPPPPPPLFFPAAVSTRPLLRPPPLPGRISPPASCSPRRPPPLPPASCPPLLPWFPLVPAPSIGLISIWFF